MTLPNFLIIGAQKAGTTWLGQMLGQHPDIFMVDNEIHYFDKDYSFSKGIDWYKKHFAEACDEQAIGEKTPDYLWANSNGVEGHLPDVHQNIYNLLPDARLIIILRNPVERAISAVNHIINTGRISPLYSIDELLVGHKQHLVEGHGVIDKGRYYKQIQAYYEYFDPIQILILVYEEVVVKNPAAGLQTACQFLGVDPAWKFENTNKKINTFKNSKLGLALKYHAPMLASLAQRLDQRLPTTKARPTSQTIETLYRLYEKDNEMLFGLIDRRLESWQL